MPSLRSKLIAIYEKQGPGAETCTCGFCGLARAEIKKRDAVIGKRRAYHQAYYHAHREDYRIKARERYKRNRVAASKKALAYYHRKKAEARNG